MAKWRLLEGLSSALRGRLLPGYGGVPDDEADPLWVWALLALPRCCLLFAQRVPLAPAVLLAHAGVLSVNAEAGYGGGISLGRMAWFERLR